MIFHYIAQDFKGRIKEGNINQPDLKASLEYLASQNLRPISVKPLAFDGKGKRKSIFKESLTLTDKVFLTKYLSLMLKVGTDLFSAIDILIEDFESGVVKRFLLEIRSNLEQGKPFWFAFSKHPEYFSSVVANLLKAGETSGNLELTLSRVSEDLERERDLSSKVKSSLMYPVLLLVAAFSMIVFLVSFAVPKLGEMFLSTGQKLPTYSKIVLTTGMFLNHYLYIFIPLAFGLPLGLFLYFYKTKNGRKNFTKLLQKVPVARGLMEKMALERFSSVLANLIHAGMPIIQAIEVTAGAVGNPQYEAALARISKEYLAKGLSIGDSFKKEKVFPPVVTNLLAIGEKAGHTEEILNTLAAFYDSEIDVSLKTLVAFIEPAMLVLIGFIVGGIALSLIVPVYQLVSSF
jgi:type IV pilus assembly protein PilC